MSQTTNSQTTYAEIGSLLARLIALEEGDQNALAKRIGVAPSTISRWLTGRNRPQPLMEARLRSLGRKRGVDKQCQFALFEPSASEHEGPLRKALAIMLRDVREILHRGGRLSSRHEALDEIAKLVFAHIMSIDTGGPGLSTELVVQDRAARNLRAFVGKVFKQHLPTSLAHDLIADDFTLRLKDNEHALAAELISAFERLEVNAITDAGSADLINDVFGQFLADSFTDEKELGQYLTPPEVVRFMTQLGLESLTSRQKERLLSPNGDGGIILDPSCGVGSFLASAMRVLLQQVRQLEETSEVEQWIHRTASTRLVGIDKSERMVRLALTNLALFGAPAVNLYLANGLARRGAEAKILDDLDGKVDLILTNPPFGAEFPKRAVSEYEIVSTWHQGTGNKVDSELLFLERYIQWLSDDGVLVAIVPDSILTNQGIFRSLRAGLADSVELISVTSLPPVTFAAAGTSTKTSVLHLRKQTKQKRKIHRCHFAVCSAVGFDVSTRGSQRCRVPTEQNQLPTILAEVLQQVDASIGTWVPFDNSEPRWDAIYHASLPTEIAERLITPRPDDLTIDNVAALVSDRVNPHRFGDDTFQYIEISDINPMTTSVTAKTVACNAAPSRARKRVHTGDVLISTVRPERRAVSVVPGWLDGAICSTGLAVLRPLSIAPLLLAKLLQTDFVNAQLLRNNIGIAYPAFDEECLPSLVLPIHGDALSRIEKSAGHTMNMRAELMLQERQLEVEIIAAVDEWGSV